MFISRFIEFQYLFIHMIIRNHNPDGFAQGKSLKCKNINLCKQVQWNKVCATRPAAAEAKSRQ